VGDRAVIEALWRELRAVVAGADGVRAGAAVGGAVAEGLLRAAVPAALTAPPAGGPAPVLGVDGLLTALRERSWPGDAVAVESLTSALSGTSTGRAGLVVDLEQLGDVLSDERGGYLELATGDVWPASVIEDGDMEDLDPDEIESDRWLNVPGDGRDAWRDMASFADQVPDAQARDDLRVAVDGKGAFRRFQGALDRHEAYRVDWRVWSSERRMGRAREWLADEGYDLIP
jgi:Uncharacterised protein family (UPF0158)